MKSELYCSDYFCFKSVQWIPSTISNIPAHLHFQPKHDEKTEKPITYFNDDTSNHQHHGKKKKKKKRSHSNGYFEVTCTLKSKFCSIFLRNQSIDKQLNRKGGEKVKKIVFFCFRRMSKEKSPHRINQRISMTREGGSSR